MFLYADVQWPTYAYGALAGINAGDSFNYATVFGSLTSNIVNIEETSNIGIPGIWIFKIGEGMHTHTYTHRCNVHICMHTCKAICMLKKISL